MMNQHKSKMLRLEQNDIYSIENVVATTTERIFLHTGPCKHLKTFMMNIVELLKKVLRFGQTPPVYPTCWSHIHSSHCSLESRFSGWRSRDIVDLWIGLSLQSHVSLVTICFASFVYVWRFDDRVVFVCERCVFDTDPPALRNVAASAYAKLKLVSLVVRHLFFWDVVGTNDIPMRKGHIWHW